MQTCLFQKLVTIGRVGKLSPDKTTYLTGAKTLCIDCLCLATTIVTQLPRDMVVMVNQTAFFACEASYNPAIDLIHDWWHNGRKIMFIKVRNLGNTVYVFVEPYYERVSTFSSCLAGCKFRYDY